MLLPYMETGRIEAGCDEAGRGCLAGAVFAAAVILPEDFKNEDLNDSKQLSEKKRYMNELALEYPAYHWLDNKGYPTKVHREAIRTHGITPYHRKTFTLLPEQLTLGF